MDLILILFLFIVLLWGFALCYAYLFEQQDTHQHLWQSGISQWNHRSLASYQKKLRIEGKNHLQLKYKKTSLLNTNWLGKVPMSFKLFQQKNRPYQLSLSSDKKMYDFLAHLHRHVNSKSKNQIKIQRSIMFPDHDRNKPQHLLLLKHSLWTQGMCHVGFTETVLPLLGIDILHQTLMGVKLPFPIPKIKSFPNLACTL